MLGNIKFIGELYRLGILQESIMHKCIKQLINKKKKGTIKDMAEDLECLSQIMTTCGKRLDHQKAKSLMDQYFERMEVLRKKHSDLPSRIRFMLQDVVELRRNNWLPRRVHRETGPKTLGQIRQEVEEMYPSKGTNGEGYSGQLHMNPRFPSHGMNFGAEPGFQTKNFFPVETNRFPHSPQYTGGFHGTSPPPPVTSFPNEGGNFQDFDFFGPMKKKPVQPAAGPQNQPLVRPLHPEMRFPPPPQKQYQVYNGYPQGHNTMSRSPRASEYQTTEKGTDLHPPRNEVVPSRDVGQRPSGYKPDLKSGKEIPPRFQRRKQQMKVENAGGYQLAQSSAEKTGSLKNGGSIVRKSPVFTSLSSNTDVTPNIRPTDQAGYKPAPTPQYSRGTPLGATNLKNPSQARMNSPRSHPIDTNFAPPRHRGPTNRRPSPTIRETNIDAIQAPFQQALDIANQQVPFSKKTATTAQEKSKNKKTSLSKVEVEKISRDILEKYFTKKTTKEQAAEHISEAKIQKKYIPVVIEKALEISLSRPDEEKDRACVLLLHFVETKIVSVEHVLEAVQATMNKLSELESEVPLVKSATASLMARMVVGDLMTLAEIAEMLTGGFHFPLFLLTLQQMSKLRGQEWIIKTFKDSKVDMFKMLPEASQSKSAVITILEGKQLQFLLPLVHIESKLANQISQNPNPFSIYKWIKENVTSDLYSDPAFINVLVSSCLEYITKMSSLSPDIDTTQNLPKDVKEKERQLLADIKPVLQKFLHDKQDLQLHALYSAQVFCCNKSFPKGLLLRLFNSMYEEDIIDEETYFVWKEDVNDSYDGKGKALFQVNTWLTWLHEAETEDDDADD